MEHHIVNPEQLQMFMRRDDRMKFSIKVYHVLQFTKVNQQFRNICGAAWCSDDKHFICHSIILGSFLGIKANTINTNFRSHGFKIVPVNSTNLSDEFTNLIDVRNWKKRVNFRYGFNPSTSISEINMIPCRPVLSSAPFPNSITIENDAGDQNSVSSMRSTSTYSAPRNSILNNIIFNMSKNTDNNDYTNNNNNNFIQNNKFLSKLPMETQILLKDDSEVFLNTEILYNKIIGEKERKELVMITATREWVSVAGSHSRCELNTLVDAICDSITNCVEIGQIKANVSYLLNNQVESTQQMDDRIPFNIFLNFFVRYGRLSQAAEFIRDLSLISSCSIPINLPDLFIVNISMGSNPNNLTLNTNSLPSSLSSSQSQLSQSRNFNNTTNGSNNSQLMSQSTSDIITPRFQSWFQPSFNDSISVKILEGQPRNAWLLRPSSTPGKFTLHHKCEEKGKSRILATHIEFNPVHLPNQPIFTVSFIREGIVGAATWRMILFDVMKLNTANGIYIETENKLSHYVTADQLVEQQAAPLIFSSQSEFQLPSSQRLF